MSRPRGNRNTAAKIEERRAKAIELMNEGKNREEIADELKVSRMTLWRDLATLRERFTENNTEAFTEYRIAQLRVLELIEKGLLDGSINSKIADSWRAIRKDISDLLGLDAPTKSVSVRVDGESSPLFLRFKKSVSGLTEEQLDAVFAFAHSLHRATPQDPTGEEWFPAKQPKILEG